jgi:transposase-like protein
VGKPTPISIGNIEPNKSDARMVRGYAIIAKGDKITQLDRETFLVPSQSKNIKYQVRRVNGEWHCECPDHQYRLVQCKHIYAVQFWLSLKRKLQKETITIKTPEIYQCKFCNSPNIIKYGKKGRKQAYHCKDCGRTFVADDEFRKLKYDPNIVTATLDLYFKGVSLRKISDHLRQMYGLQIDFSTVYRWIERYIRIMSEYVKTLIPELSGEFHADEMNIKVKGNWRWLWSIMDRDTRFLLASQITEKREIEDARRLFQKAKAIAKTKPKRVVTDGLPAYRKAFTKEFWVRNKAERPEHISHVRLAGDINNNLIERLHGTRRERDKVLRGMKKSNTPIIRGFDIYYNFIRPHQGLNGRTPAEEAKINLKLDQNRWLSLIKQAINHQTKCNTPKTTH